MNKKWSCVNYSVLGGAYLRQFLVHIPPNVICQLVWHAMLRALAYPDEFYAFPREFVV